MDIASLAMGLIIGLLVGGIGAYLFVRKSSSDVASLAEDLSARVVTKQAEQILRLAESKLDSKKEVIDGTLKHMKDVVNPFLKAGRPHVGLVGYSLPGKADPIRKKMYRSVNHEPSKDERKQGAKELAAKLTSFDYKNQ